MTRHVTATREEWPAAGRGPLTDERELVRRREALPWGQFAKSGNAAAPGAADWLRLAAAPTFAAMTLLTGVLGGGRPDMLCSAAPDALALGGMIPMYVLMTIFHSVPWLKLISRRRSGLRRS